MFLMPFGILSTLIVDPSFATLYLVYVLLSVFE